MTLTPDDTILGLLAFHPQHGYQLLEIFRDPAELGCVWNLSVSQLYAVLKRLHTQGYILGKKIPSSAAPTRVEYTLSPPGQERLRQWLQAPHPPASVRSVRVEFLSRIYVARLLNMPTTDIIRCQKESCLQKYAALVSQRNAAQPGIGYLALDLHIAQLNAILSWIDRCEMTPKR